jgi:receptor protein-tyrosine kinase/non-specific protein-tyrosine kinase
MGDIFDALRRAEELGEDLQPNPAPDAPRPAATSAPRGFEPRSPGPTPRPAAVPAPEVVPEPSEPKPDEDAARVQLSTELMADWVARTVVAAPTTDAASRYRHAALRVRHALKQARGSLFAVSSANAGEGKTTTSCNLALALASMTSGGSVALVDVDLRSPRVASALGIEFEIGFEQVLSGEVALRDARLRTQFEALDLYPSHCWGRDSHALLADARTARVLEEIGGRYDAVVLDCPPVLPVPDTRLISEHADALMLVVRAGSTRTRALEEALRHLEQARVAGIFVNCLEQRGAASSYYYAYGEQEAP